MPSEVERLAEEFSRELLTREVNLMSSMADQWREVMRRINDDINRLALRIAELQNAGIIVDQQYLFTMQRYQSLLAQAKEKYNDYARNAERLIEYRQKDSFLLGAAFSEQEIDLALRGIRADMPAWTRINEQAFNVMVSQTRKGAPLYQLLERSYGSGVDGLTTELLNSIARGQGAKQLAEAMTAGFGVAFNRSLLIAQTEMGRAYRIGSIQQFRQTRFITGYRRLVQKNRACLACLVLDGEYYSVAEDMSDHPRGHCDVIAVIEGAPPQEWELGEDWLVRQPEDVQRRIMGNTRFEAWKNGDLLLSDMVKKISDPIWGEQPAIKTLKELGLVSRKLSPKSSAPTPAPPPPTPPPAPVIDDLAAKVAEREAWYAGRMNDLEVIKNHPDWVNDFIAKEFPMVNVSALPDESKIAITRGLIRVKAKFPAMFENGWMERITIDPAEIDYRLRGYFSGRNSGCWGITVGGRSISLNEAWYSNLVKADAEYLRCVLLDFHPYLGDYSGVAAEGVLVHEIGHVLDGFIEDDSRLKTLRSQMIDDAKLAKSGRIGRYSDTNDAELFAEMFSQYIMVEPGLWDDCVFELKKLLESSHILRYLLGLK